MKKKFRYAALAVLCLFLIVLAINLGDQKLNPEIASLVQTRPSGLETPGLDLYLGLASKSENWKEAGAQFKSELQRLETSPSQKAYSDFYHRYKEQLVTLDLDHREACKPICTPEELQQKKSGIQKYLSAHHQILLRYREYLAVPEVREPAFPHFSLVLLRAGSVNSLGDLFHLYLQVNPDSLAPSEIVDLLVKEGQFHLRSLQQKRTLLNQMIGLHALRENIKFLDDFVDAHPNTKKQIPADYIARLRAINAQQVVQDAIFGELLIVHEVVQLEPSAADFNVPGAGLLSVFLQRNATLNYFGDRYQAFLSSSCVQTQQLKDCREQDFNPITFPWYSYLVNPVGKTYAKILLPKFVGTYEKIRAINGQIQQGIAKLN